MSHRTTTRLTIIVERIEETAPERDSRPVITTTGESVDELPSRPGLASTRPVTALAKVG